MAPSLLIACRRRLWPLHGSTGEALHSVAASHGPFPESVSAGVPNNSDTIQSGDRERDDESLRSDGFVGANLP